MSNYNRNSDMELKKIAKKVREDILKMYRLAGWGHIAPALSCADILTVLYFGGIIDWSKRFSDNRDRVILSKGHACAALYSVLSLAGFYSRSELRTFYQYGSHFTGLSNVKVPGVELSTGSLGHGASFAIGSAIASHKAKDDGWYTYTILGDGESQEGSVWEAAMFAGAKHLSKIVFILDNNGLQGGDFVNETISLNPIADKWESFGWKVFEVDGNDTVALKKVFEEIKAYGDGPVFLIANTIKGKGITFMENNPAWHSRAPKTEEEWRKACEDIGITMKELDEI